MKGPGLRIRLDVRRVWKCPQCGKQIRLPGQQVSYPCPCTSPPTWMHLLPDPKPPEYHFEKISIPEPVEEEPLPEPERPPLPQQPTEETAETTADASRPSEQTRPPRRDHGRHERTDRNDKRRDDRRPPRQRDNGGKAPPAEALPAPEPAPQMEAAPPPPPQPAGEDDFGAGL